jgi:putative DNA primase/helicase
MARRSESEIAEMYDYRDEQRRRVFQVVRFTPKRFAQRRPDGKGGWVWNMRGVRPLVYRLPELIAELEDMSAGERGVYVVEGEKDVKTLRKHGFPATTSPGGAGKWHDEHSRLLNKARADSVIILPDNDAPGRAHAEGVARSCARVGLKTKIVELPGLSEGEDVTDWLQQNSAKALRTLERATPLTVVAEVAAHSANSGSGYMDGGQTEYKFRPIKAGKLVKLSTAPLRWVWEGYLPEGTLALLSAYMKQGKTTLAYALGIAVCHGEPFLSHPTKSGRVLILAVEENRRDVVARLRKFGMQKRDGIYVHAGRVSAGESTMRRIRRFVEKKSIVLVIVDTLARFWGIRDENNNSEVVRHVSPWLDLAHETGVVVLLVHHDRKSGGEEGRSIRGGSALLGLVDQALMLERTPGGGNRRRRILRTLGRYDETPPEVVIELDGTSYRSLGTSEELSARADQRRVWKALSKTPQTSEDLAKTIKLTPKKVKRALKGLGDRVKRSGRGVRGAAYLYARRSNSIQP